MFNSIALSSASSRDAPNPSSEVLSRFFPRREIKRRACALRLEIYDTEGLTIPLKGLDTGTLKGHIDRGSEV